MRPSHETFREEVYRDINRDMGYVLARRGNALLKEGRCDLAIEDFAQAREHGIDGRDPVMAGEDIARYAIRDWLANRDCEEVPNVKLACSPRYLAIGDGEVLVYQTWGRSPEYRSQAINFAEELAADEELRLNYWSAGLVITSPAFDVKVYDFDGQRVELIHTAKPCDDEQDEEETEATALTD